ncbi:MAG: hypothetical protein SOY36_06925 [Oscillospiraceae bacterium]|nr:hypothetical protein [Oscillospiraceae bacterium]
MENEAKRAKRGIIIAFSVLVCILLVIAVIFFMYRSQHTFSQEKWLSNASERYMIVDDMLEKHPLIGISEDNVIALLGAEDGDGQSSFKLSDKNYPPETTLVYHLGVEYIDNMWLIISISDGTVTEYCIDVT